MKISNTKRNDLRGQMRERQRRDRSSTPLMRERYPAIASLRLEFDFSDGGDFTPVPQMTVLHPPATAYFIFPCPFTDCDGEFNLAPVVDALASEGRRHDEGQLQCCGHRTGMGENRAQCHLVLEYSVYIQEG